LHLPLLQAGIGDDTLHTPHIFPYISDVLPASDQILSEDNVEDCPSTVSLSEKSTDEESVIKADECSGIKLNANETQELMKDADVASAKDIALTPDIIVSDANTTPKLLPTQPTSHL
jgi:hypothetical protein